MAMQVVGFAAGIATYPTQRRDLGMMFPGQNWPAPANIEGGTTYALERRPRRCRMPSTTPGAMQAAAAPAAILSVDNKPFVATDVLDIDVADQRHVRNQLHVGAAWVALQSPGDGMQAEQRERFLAQPGLLLPRNELGHGDADPLFAAVPIRVVKALHAAGGETDLGYDAGAAVALHIEA